MRKTTLIALAPASILLAACGSGGGGSGGTAKDTGAAAVRFAQCMRAGGINVPDPGADGGIRMRVGPGTSPAKVEKLQKDCFKKSGMPAPKAPPPAQQKEFEDSALKFAACMREHGVDMPDPQFSGGRVQMTIKKGTLSAPRVQAAQQACQKLNPIGKGGPGPGSSGALKSP